MRLLEVYVFATPILGLLAAVAFVYKLRHPSDRAVKADAEQPRLALGDR